MKYVFLFLSPQNNTDMNEDEAPPPSSGRRKRNAEPEPVLVTSPPTFTATISDRAQTTGSITASFSDATDQISNTEAPGTEGPSPSYASSSSHSNSTDSTVYETPSFSPTSAPLATLPPWLMTHSQGEDTTSESSPSALTPGQLRLSTHDASMMGHFSTRSAAASGTTGQVNS